MVPDYLKFEPGEIIQFSTGEYSDYCTTGQIVTTQRINLVELGHAYKAENSELDFQAWLVVNGYAVHFHLTEIHLGSYGQFDLSEIPL